MIVYFHTAYKSTVAPCSAVMLKMPLAPSVSDVPFIVVAAVPEAESVQPTKAASVRDKPSAESVESDSFAS